MELTDIDEPMQKKIENFHDSVQKIEDILGTALDKDEYEKLDLKGKVDYDLFISYTLNTLYWLYLRTKGINPATSQVKDELVRIRQYMMKRKQAHDRNTIRPRIDKAAAGRFVKHGIHQSDKEHGKKRKLDDD